MNANESYEDDAQEGTDSITTRRRFLGAAAAALSLASVSGSATAATDRTVYDGDTGGDLNRPVPFVQLAGDGQPQSTIFGEGAEVAVNVEGGETTVEITAELEAPERLLDRDIISVQLAGKDLPREEA